MSENGSGWPEVRDYEINQRVERVQERLREHKLSAAVCFGAHRDYCPGDLRYFSRWSCTDEETAYVFIPASGPTTLVIDAEWDYGRAFSEACAGDILLDANPQRTLTKLLSEYALGGASVGIGGFRSFPAPVYESLRLEHPAVSFVDWSHVLDRIKLVKSTTELELLRHAANITDAGMAAGIAAITPDAIEAEVAASAEYAIRRTGAELSFVTVMGAGVRTSGATFFPQNRKMVRGEYAILDCGARVNGYHGDMCRTVVVGGADEKQLDVLETVAEAVRAGTEAARPGATVGDVHNAAKAAVIEGGYGASWWGYYMPHGFGTAQHEAPFGAGDAATILERGMVLCIEPGILLAGEGAVILEQMVAVTASGAETMNKLPLDLWDGT